MELADLGMGRDLFAESVVVEAESLNLLGEEGRSTAEFAVLGARRILGAGQLCFEVTDPFPERLSSLVTLSAHHGRGAAKAVELGDDLACAVGSGSAHAGLSRQVRHGELSVAMLSGSRRQPVQRGSQRLLRGRADAHR